MRLDPTLDKLSRQILSVKGGCDLSPHGAGYSARSIGRREGKRTPHATIRLCLLPVENLELLPN